MIIHVEFYKRTGKFYTDCDIDLPDETQLFDKGLFEKIMQTQDAIDPSTREFMVYVNLAEKEEERLPQKFFKYVFNTRGTK